MLHKDLQAHLNGATWGAISLQTLIATLLKLTMLLILVLPARAGDGTPEDPLVFGIIPARSPERILSDFGPLVEAMERELDLSIRIRGAPDFETFIRRVLEGSTYDLILTGGDTVQFIREMDLYKPIMQMDGQGIFAMIAVKADAPFTTLEDLRGEGTLATADLLAYSTGLGFRRLTEAGLDPATDLDVVFVPSQSAALAVLMRGQVDAAIIMAPVLRAAPADMREGIRILAETERAPPPAISLSNSMPTDLAERIVTFFLTFQDLPDSASTLRSMGWKGLIPVRIEDYDALDWAAQSIAERLEALAD